MPFLMFALSSSYIPISITRLSTTSHCRGAVEAKSSAAVIVKSFAAVVVKSSATVVAKSSATFVR
jgi:hypothetical protein